MSKVNFINLKEKMDSVKNEQLSKVDFYKWLDENIKVEKYLSLSQKYSIIKLFVINFQYKYIDKLMSGELDIGAEYFYMQYDIETLFELLIPYIDVEVKKEYKNIDNYDLIFISGLYDYIVSKCNSDYLLLKEKCDTVIGIKDLTVINKLSEFVEKNINISEFNEFMVKFDSIMKKKNVRENLKFINNINMFNDPNISKMIDIIQDESVKEIKGVNQ